MRALFLVALVAVAVGLAVVLTRDPEEAWAVGAVILASAVAAGAVATMLQLRSGGRRRVRARASIAGRRGIEVAAIVALLLWLRAVDGLSILTATFVIGSFVVAEAILSARPQASR